MAPRAGFESATNMQIEKTINLFYTSKGIIHENKSNCR